MLIVIQTVAIQSVLPQKESTKILMGNVLISLTKTIVFVFMTLELLPILLN